MGAIGGMLGTGGGAAGTGIKGPQGATITAPVTPDQVNAANAGVQSSLGSQQAAVNAANSSAQGGLSSQQALLNALQGNTGNLNNVYDQGQGAYGQISGLNGAGTMGAGSAGTGQLASSLAGAGGVGLQSSGAQGLLDVLGQQQGLAGQYQNIAAGRGPNPAQAMLNNATGQNVANQAALMAGQRGAGTNVGLMARQAAQQGAATQQQAVGQGATMQAQQQMNALSGLGAQQQAMGATNQALAGIGSGLTGQQAQAYQSLYGQGQGEIAAQQAQQGLNAGIAQNQIGNQMGVQNALTQNTISNAGQQMNAQNALTQNSLANAGQQMGAINATNQAQVGSQGSINSANAALANTGMQGQQSFIGGAMNGAAAAFMAGGGEAEPATGVLQPPGAQSSFGKFLSGYGATTAPDASADATTGPQQLEKGSSALTKALVKKARGSGTGTEATPGGYAGSDMSALGSVPMTAARGGPVGEVRARSPAQKPTKAGDSYANDKVPAMLSAGEVVLPRSVTLGPNAPEAAKRFLEALQARKGRAS